jgi:hypothetical protein
VKAQEEGEGASGFTGPLDIEILFPANDSYFGTANFTALIEADGATARFVQDDFVNGTFVNASFDSEGVRANASGPTNESYYISRVFESGVPAGAVEWTTPLDYLTSGSTADPTTLLAIDARYGDGTTGRNWSAWVVVALDGDLGDPRNPANESLLERPAFQYRVRFLDPLNASSPRVVFVEVWSIAHIVEVAARVVPGGDWSVLGTSEGRYNFSVTMAPGAALLQARVLDARGRNLTVEAAVTYDVVPPAIEQALPTGSSVAPDTAAEIRFTEPIDRASASVNVAVEAAFPVDLVWSADNRSLFVSAQESGRRGPVKITLGAGLRDRVGNTVGSPTTLVYEMGAPIEAPRDNAPLLVALFAVIGVVGGAALVISSRARKRSRDRAQQMRDGLDRAPEPPKPPE